MSLARLIELSKQILDTNDPEVKKRLAAVRARMEAFDRECEERHRKRQVTSEQLLKRVTL